jgi:hypothetical protein
MGTASAEIVLRHIRQLATAEPTELLDQQLLQRFIVQHEEAAFAALVRRHSPLVLGVCRRVLHNWHDAEDAYQATFLVLARKARSIADGFCPGWTEGIKSVQGTQNHLTVPQIRGDLA